MPKASPATSPPAIPTSAPAPPNTDHLASPPATGMARSTAPRPMSHASRNRLSTYSTGTGSIPSRSRPASYLFPIFHSSLAYTIVRDFAYTPMSPLHYGPPPEPSPLPSGVTTPSSESKRFSDPPASWEGGKLSWNWTPEGGLGRGNDLAPIRFGDGPPYSEDEDLQSPVVSSRHKRHRSNPTTLEHGSARAGTGMNYEAHSGTYGTYGGSERYYVDQGGEAAGSGGDYVNYPPGFSQQGAEGYEGSGVRRSQRYSRDYQFTITSPDEEMHGKAVALFDFERENENELPLVEGQIIWVSYRHGQGWLVAEDPKTQESGLVPEEYVRLLRDIEGGMNSLTNEIAADLAAASPDDAGTPTQTEHVANLPPATPSQPQQSGHKPTSSNPTNGYHHPVVSTFSTSSKDLDLYPQHLLGTQSGQAPPQVVHYHGQRGGSGSQVATPTVQNSFDGGMGRRGSQDTSKGLETLPNKKHNSSEAAGIEEQVEPLER
ncbi:SH3 domain-containing protein [Microdochium nivale]|nr:SH3 domain-containing protein [Microdochium nivale]